MPWEAARAAGRRHSGLAGDSAARGEDAWLSGPAPRHAVPAWLASHLQDRGSEERGGARVAGGRRGVGTKGHRPAGQGRPPPRTGSLFRPRYSGQGACPQGPSLGSGRVARQMGPAAEGNSLPPRGRTRPPPAHSSGAFHQRGRGQGSPCLRASRGSRALRFETSLGELDKGPARPLLPHSRGGGPSDGRVHPS